MSILRNINYLVEISRLPCAQPDALIIIKTAFKSAPPAMLQLFLPGCTDILKTRIGNSPWHLRGIRGLIKGAIKPYPINEQKFLYKIGYYTAEKYLWWWMVADVTSEFITTWQSMIYQEQQCELPGAGTAAGYITPFIYNPGSEGNLDITPTSYHPGVAWVTGGVGILPGYEASIAWSAQWDSWPTRGLGANIDTWMYRDDIGVVEDFMESNAPGAYRPGWTGGSMYHRDIEATTPKIYRIGYANTGDTHVQAVSSTFSVSLTGRRQGNLSWGCHPKPVTWPFPNPLA